MASTLTFSPNSQRIAYAARMGDKWALVVDGIAGKPHDAILAGPPAFSPDSRRVAYGAKIGVKWSVVIEGVEGKAYYDLGGASITFSADSRRVAYKARTRDIWTGFKSTVVVDGVEKGHCEHIGGRLLFSPDGETVYEDK
jgi:glucose/arabinose dehydrogenase